MEQAAAHVQSSLLSDCGHCDLARTVCHSGGPAQMLVSTLAGRSTAKGHYLDDEALWSGHLRGQSDRHRLHRGGVEHPLLAREGRFRHFQSPESSLASAGRWTSPSSNFSSRIKAMHIQLSRNCHPEVQATCQVGAQLSEPGCRGRSSI